MLGKSHLLVGAAGFLAVGEPVLGQLGVQPRPAEMLAGAVVCAGAAMLPDLDHPEATVTKSLGPLTEIPSGFLSSLAGGHRNGTHSFLFAALSAFGAFGLASGWMSAPWGALLIAFFFSALVVRVLTEARGFVCAGLAMVISTVVVMAHVRVDVLAAAVGLGCLLHMLGDFVTPEGVPPLWPVSKIRWRFPIVGTTGDNIEKLLAGAAGVWALWAYLTQIAAPAILGHKITVAWSQIPVPHVAGGTVAMLLIAVCGIVIGVGAVQTVNRFKNRGRVQVSAPQAAATTDPTPDETVVDSNDGWPMPGAGQAVLADDFIARPDAAEPVRQLELPEEPEVEEPQDWPWRGASEPVDNADPSPAVGHDEAPAASAAAEQPTPEPAAAEAVEPAPLLPPAPQTDLDEAIAAKLREQSEQQIRFRPSI